jgi:hypothetical protein
MPIDPLTAGIGLATAAIQRIWPDKSAEEARLLAGQLQIVQGQLAVNQAEAGSSSTFVAGWRPFIGWVCGSACAWNWIGLPVVKAGLLVFGGPTLDLSPADLTEMLPVLMGMLGLGALRTFEKTKGVAR